MRSGDPAFRERAVAIDDYFVDVRYESELVRARRVPDVLLLHKGGDAYIKLPLEEYGRIKSARRATRGCAGCNP